jgi:hypothetical protein
MDRVKEIFLWIFNLYQPNKYNFLFIKTNDTDNVPKDVLYSRIEREKDSLISLKNIIKSITSMKELNEWLYTEHKAYSCSYLKKEDIPENIKKSY